MISLVAALSTVWVFATGNQLYSTCSQNSTECRAYIMGVADGITLMQDAVKIRMVCPPKDVTGDQITAVVFKHLSDHPETRHMAAADLIEDALGRAFPCTRRRR